MWCEKDNECATFKPGAKSGVASATHEEMFVRQEQVVRENTNFSRPDRRDNDDSFLFSQIDVLLKEHQDRMLGRIADMMMEQTKVLHGLVQHDPPSHSHFDSRHHDRNSYDRSMCQATAQATKTTDLDSHEQDHDLPTPRRDAARQTTREMSATQTHQTHQGTATGSRQVSLVSPLPPSGFGHGHLVNLEQYPRHSSTRDTRSVRKSMKAGRGGLELFKMGPSPGRGCSHWREWLQYIVRSNLFELTFAAVITSNSIFVGVQVNHSAVERTTAVPHVMFAIQTVYCVIFTLEMIVRILAEGREYINPVGQNFGWNMLDVLVVSTSIAELVIDSVALTQESFSAGSNVRDASNVRVIRVLRIVRMVRIVRIAKILKFIHALRTFIYSIMATIKSLIWALLLLAIIIYVFGIVLTQSVSDHIIDLLEREDEQGAVDRLDLYWGNLPKSMFTLFKSICGGLSWHDGVHPMAKVGFAWVGVFIAYIAFTYFAVLNVVTGIFCHSAIETAQQNEDLVVQIQMANKKSYIDRIKRVFKAIDDDESGAITIEELEAHLSDETMQAIFTSLEIDTEDAYSLFRLLDTDGGNYIDIDEFVSGLMRLRGNAKRVDVLEIQQTMRKLGDRLTALCVYHGLLNMPGTTAQGSNQKVHPAMGALGVSSAQLKRATEVVRTGTEFSQRRAPRSENTRSLRTSDPPMASAKDSMVEGSLTLQEPMRSTASKQHTPLEHQVYAACSSPVTTDGETGRTLEL